MFDYHICQVQACRSILFPKSQNSTPPIISFIFKIIYVSPEYSPLMEKRGIDENKNSLSIHSLFWNIVHSSNFWCGNLRYPRKKPKCLWHPKIWALYSENSDWQATLNYLTTCPYIIITMDLSCMLAKKMNRAFCFLSGHYY